jgi:hypothetical protein
MKVKRKNFWLSSIMNFEYQKVIAREFILFVSILVISALLYFLTYPYNNFIENGIAVNTSKVWDNQIKVDSLIRYFKNKQRSQEWSPSQSEIADYKHLRRLEVENRKLKFEIDTDNNRIIQSDERFDLVVRFFSTLLVLVFILRYLGYGIGWSIIILRKITESFRE